MDWADMLDSLVNHFTDHHDAQVLNQQLDAAAVRKPEWVHDDSTTTDVQTQSMIHDLPVRADHEGKKNLVGLSRFQNVNPIQEKLLMRQPGSWEVTADPYRLTKDRIPQASLDWDYTTQNDTPYTKNYPGWIRKK